MGADPVFILLTILAAVLIGYWMTHQARKKRRPPQAAVMPPTARQSQKKNAMLTELNAELDRLGALLQPTKQTEPGPQMHVLKSLRLISAQLMQLHKRLETLEREAADARRLQQQYDKP